MIYPKQNNIIRLGFHLYVRFIVARNFNATNFNSIDIDNDKSILLIANHSGFWDGFLLYWLRCKLLKKKFHIMLLEETSKRIPVLKYGGAFSIKKKSRDVIESLNYAAQLLKYPGNMVLIFPQGKLHSNYITEVVFEKGVMNIIKQGAGDFQLIFSATFIENFAHKKPTAYIYLKSPGQDSFNSIDDLQQAYQQHYNNAHQQQTQITV